MGDIDTKTRHTFEILTGYFVDVFYNDLFLKARDTTNSRGFSTHTDKYRELLNTYCETVKSNPAVYKKIVKSLHEYYKEFTDNSIIGFLEFEHVVLSHFIPASYFKDFTELEKDRIFSEIIISATAAMIGQIKEKYMSLVVDKRKTDGVIDILQTSMVDIFIKQRREIYTKFATQTSQAAAKESKLKLLLVAEVKKRCAAEAERDTAINLLAEFQQRIKKIMPLIKLAAAPRDDIIVPARAHVSDFRPITAEEKKPKSPTPENEITSDITDTEEELIKKFVVNYDDSGF